MSKMHKKTVGIIPDLRNTLGGPGFFQRNLAQGLARRGIGVDYDQNCYHIDALLIVNGSRNIGLLWRCRRRGIRIVQRVGLPDVRDKPMLSLYTYWQAIKANIIMPIIREYFANHVVYQSQFAQDWWNKLYGISSCESSLIYNGVDLSLFIPEGDAYKSEKDVCIISVEGMQINPEKNPAFLVAQSLVSKGYSVELLVVGNLWNISKCNYANHSFVRIMGVIPHEKLPFFYRGATLFVSNDLVAACPNSVIEALACGTPILGYNSRILPEMLTQDAGICISDESYCQNREHSDLVNILCKAAIKIIDNNDSFRKGARGLAEDRYGLDHMIDQYETALFH